MNSTHTKRPWGATYPGEYAHYPSFCVLGVSPKLGILRDATSWQVFFEAEHLRVEQPFYFRRALCTAGCPEQECCAGGNQGPGIHSGAAPLCHQMISEVLQQPTTDTLYEAL